MQLDWTTFALEILNFLVLIWILTRFLYRPVLGVVARRKADIEGSLAEAERRLAEAKALRDQYDGRVADWEREKEGVRTQLQEELRVERARRLDELRTALEQEREKARVLEARRGDELVRQAETAAVAQGTRFLARLLERFADRKFEARLVEVVLEDLRGLSDSRREAVRAACTKGQPAGTVTSAYPIEPGQREALGDAIRALVGRPVSLEWREDAALLAGVRISLGPWLLQANLQDELRFFSEADRAGVTVAS